jgi:flagellar hook-associated protein 1 FlgK
MAISSFVGLQTSLRALLAQQAALDVTGHNIANANTVGYTRQEAVLSAATPLSLEAGALQNGSGAQLGQGVDVLQYRRMRDMFADLQYRAQNMTLGDQKTKSAALDQAQTVLGEPSDTGINALFGKFWNAWQDVANHPESAAAKTALVGHAQNLVTSINQLASNLGSIQTVAGQQLTQLTGASGPVQSAATQIASLNQHIKDAVGAGQQPNDLLDQRDQLIDQLSGYAQVSVTDLGNGSLQVSLDGQMVVNDTTFSWPAPYVATNGQLGALSTLASAGGPIGGYLTDLDAIASQLATSVNGLHAGFFSGTTAATIAVAVTPAGVTPGSTGGPGANDIALAVAALRGGASDASKPYADLVAQMGSDAANATRATTSAQSLVDAVEQRRQESGGVSLDEEMTNMVRFQRGYQAASRAFSTMDEMLDVLINRTGRVGL